MNCVEDFMIEDGVLVEYRGEDTEVVIPPEVKSIGSLAFWSQPRVERVVMGDGVTTIAPHAFAECRYLEEIVLSPAVTTIGDHAF